MPASRRDLWVALAGLGLVLATIGAALLLPRKPGRDAAPPPEGFSRVLRFVHNGERLRFGPFVGYAFRPVTAGDPSEVAFVCRNDGQFYTRDQPTGALLYRGTARLTDLPESGRSLPRDGRINPVFFREAPAAWTASRPDPAAEYLHFHSCYNEAGAVRTGYWLRHVAQASFTYDMGGRVGPQSPLYHRVSPGVDTRFARVLEFDHGPAAGRDGE
jgi:hypothetical protein